MKKLLYILFFFLGSVPLFAQAPYEKWLYQLGNPGQAAGEISVQVNSEGDIIVGGGFQGFYDFDYGSGTVSKRGEYFVQKISKEGELIWLKVWETFAFEERRKMVIDKNDNIYFCGSYFGDVDFDLGPDSAKLTNGPVFVVKLDTDGDFIWAKGFGGIESISIGYANHVLALAVDDDENVFLSGSFLGTTNFDTANDQELQTSNGETDIYVLKLDSHGDFEWVRTMGDYEYDYPLKMEVDSDGNIYTVGQFIGKMDADPSSDQFWLNSYGHYDAFVQKLNTDGELVWAYSLGASGYDSAEALYVSNRCDVYVGGVFEHVADFDPGPDEANIYAPNSSINVFLQKVNCDGELQWAKVFGSPNNDLISDIFVDDLDQVFITGWLREAGDIDPGLDTFLTNNTDFSGFLTKFRSNGDFAWGTNIRGGESNYSKVTGDNMEHVFLIGRFSETANFHPKRDSLSELTSFGSSDLFFQKLQHCDHSTQDIFINSCQPYTSPSGKYIHDKTTVFQDTLPNTTGCDSILTIHLEIKKIQDIFDAILISPNPTTGIVHLTSEFPICDADISIYSIDGKKLTPQVTAKEKFEITISFDDLAKGAYILMIGKDDDYTAYRIVKK